MSRPNSNGSTKSLRSGYRRVAKDSYVDETLFGNTKPGPAANKQSKFETFQQSAATATAVPEVITLKRSDLERMLKPSVIMTAEEVAAAKREVEAKREQERAVSKARKEKMIKLEEEAKKQQPPTETELLKRQADDATTAKAQFQLLEEKDEVKHMNQMMLYSKCVTIRDAQVEEKKHMMLEDEEENRKLDTMMEIERLKALQQYEERERQRAEERKRGAKILSEQINERERERIRQEELRDQERIQVMKEIERLKEEEMQAQIEKKLQARALMEEVAAANQEQIKRKEINKQREKEEELRIAQYIIEKELREQQLQAEKDRIAKEKELEVARLRAQQERAADKQSELDELRARRYQEAKEREWRAKEQALAERSTIMQKELAVAREAQKASKMKQRAEMAVLEHDEFQRVLDVNRRKEQDEMQQRLAKMTIDNKFKEDLLSQIQANSEREKQQRQEYLEEGRRIREAAEREKQLLLQVKQRKLKELNDAGVPAKYKAELEKMRIG